MGVVLLAAWAARTAFILLMPPAFSLDARHWYEVAEALAQGRNPYSVTFYLNWPPLWMQVTWAIAQLSTLAQVPFARVLQAVLILIESAAIVALFRLLRRLAPAADIRLALLAGISLDPIAILLICQHVNFDVIVALWIVLVRDEPRPLSAKRRRRGLAGRLPLSGFRGTDKDGAHRARSTAGARRLVGFQPGPGGSVRHSCSGRSRSA